MRVVVTGCGRSGTQYVARLLAACGFRSAHESVFKHDLEPNDYDRDLADSRWRDIDMEVSWLAAPFVSKLAPDVFVWHQTRDPIKVVRCWAHHRLLTHVQPVLQFVNKALPETAHGSQVERAVQYVLGWNELIERQKTDGRYVRFAVEKLTPERLGLMLYLAGHRLPDAFIANAMRRVPVGTGACGQHNDGDGPSWSEIVAVPGGRALSDMAERYGYDRC